MTEFNPTATRRNGESIPPTAFYTLHEFTPTGSHLVREFTTLDNAAFVADAKQERADCAGLPNTYRVYAGMSEVVYHAARNMSAKSTT